MSVTPITDAVAEQGISSDLILLKCKDLEVQLNECKRITAIHCRHAAIQHTRGNEWKNIARLFFEGHIAIAPTMYESLLKQENES